MPTCHICGSLFDEGSWGSPDESRQPDPCDCGECIGTLELEAMPREELAAKTETWERKVREAMMPELTDDLEADIDYEGED